MQVSPKHRQVVRVSYASATVQLRPPPHPLLWYVARLGLVRVRLLGPRRFCLRIDPKRRQRITNPRRATPLKDGGLVFGTFNFIRHVCQFANDVDRWGAHVNAVMNLQVP
jgi:hypothetical protein